MGTTQTVTFTVTNTSTGGQTGDRIYEIRFRISSGSLFNASTAAPAGWTRTAYSTTSVTFRATSWANAIATGSSLPFAIAINFRSSSSDITNERLRDARASFTTDTNFGNGIWRSGRSTVNNPGQWNLRSLALTSFQITDLAGVPITALAAGNPFRVVMTVTNNSTAPQASIVSNPSPPSAVLTGTTFNPNPLTLAAGATGTITFTYSTNASDSGTIYFTASARNNTNNATSITATSGTLSISRFYASLNVNPSCQYEGQTITVTMTLANEFPYNIINVTPNLAPSAGAPVILQNGPLPIAPNGPVIANGGTFVYNWIYLVSGGNPGDTFTFIGSATGTGQTGGNPVRTTPLATSPSIKRGGFTPVVSPANTNAESADEELTWTIINQGCAAVTSVAITIPAGWTLLATDAYSLIGQFNPPNPGVNPIPSIENVWQVNGANPVVFSAPPAPPDFTLPVTTPAMRGDFSLIFSATPAGTGVNTFTLRITDANGTVIDRTTDVTVDAFKSGGKNDVNTGVWREDIP
jgi:hypothetical protein